MELSDEALIYIIAPRIPIHLDREKFKDILLVTQAEQELVEFSLTLKEIFFFYIPWGRVPTLKLKSRWKKGKMT